MVFGTGGGFFIDRWAMGCFLAPVHRTRYFLDSGTYGDLSVWCPRWHRMWIPDPQGNISTLGGVNGNVRAGDGVERATRRIPDSMGRARDVDVRTLR